MAEDLLGPDPTEPTEPSSKPRKKGKAVVEIRVELDLDDLEIFDLRGEGITTVSVVSN